jgi:amino acid adenylation domain-containing protein
MTDLASRLAGLSPQKRELLLRQLAAKAPSAPAAPARIPRLPREEGVANRFPVSASQLREWILDRLQPGTSAYNIPGGIRVRGPLDPAVLQRSVREIVRRHESLRTTFAAQDGEPVQVVSPDFRAPVPLVDLGGLPEALRPPEARRIGGEESLLPFDLERGPLLRMRHVRLDPREHLVLFTMHHIVSDGWSGGIFQSELGVLYDALVHGRSSPLPELPVQYADFAAWQRERLDGGALEAQIAYWRQQLAGAPPLLELPTDRPRPPVQGFRGAKHPFFLPPESAAALRDLVRQEGATPFMAVFAAFAALLARHSGQEDLTVGTYNGNRGRAELEGLIGFFINTLVLRLDLTGAPSFRELLRRAREVTLQAFAHQDVPFERLLETLRVERDLSRTPLFQVLLVLQNFPGGDAEVKEVMLESVSFEHDRSDFDLGLWLTESPIGLGGVFSYAVELFDPATIARLSGHLGRLLAAVLADPDRSVPELPLLSDAERHQLLAEWGEGTFWDDQDRCLHTLFEDRARSAPDSIALEWDGGSLTYAELNRRADRWAAHLWAQGVGPESLVGLQVERSPEMIVAMLAILKAGGAYLPLDPAYPEARISLMLEDAAVSVLLTRERLAEEPSENVVGTCTPPDPRNPAYVIYTSGSTGKPKGVVVEHRSIAAYTASAAAAFELRPEDRVLQFASISFDTSGEEIYPALASGATLVLRPDDMAGSIAHFLRELERLRITVLDLPTAYWHELVAGLGAEGPLPDSLRLVILGGEKALPDRLALWREKVGDRVRLLNTYGPTETTIVATRRDLTEGPPNPPNPPIGRPIPGARAHVLDRRGLPVPLGVAGELLVGGPGVARGYLRRPEITAERFVPDPFAGTPGTRLYRTGDLVRWKAAGELEFLGRVDQQVKIRGFRVELEEIEAALRAHPAVRDAAVALRDPRLVAWIVREPGSEISSLTSELRSFLGGRLPEYMVPSLFQELPALPLTPSGKVDRRGLPEPEGLRPDLGTGYVAPKNELERSIAAVWRELLGVDRVGVEDNFFDLGAHSLLMVRAHARLREALGRELTVIDLFRHPSVGALARHLSKEEEKPEFRQVQNLAQQQKAAQNRQRQAMEKLKKATGGGPRR